MDTARHRRTRSIGFSPRRGALVAAGLAVTTGTLMVLAATGASADSAKNAAVATNKITICHATASVHNPYVVIDIDVAGAYNGHLGHTGPVFSPDLAKHVKWGDIIPPGTYNGHDFSLNWDAAGQAIWNNDCAPAPSTATVTATATVTKTATQTATQTETQTKTETATVTAPASTVTQTATVTAPASTVTQTATVTAPASTVTQTATDTVTVTAPASTVTETKTDTATVTETATVTSTEPGPTAVVTVTAPASTVTETTTAPGTTETVTAPASTVTETTTAPGSTETVTAPASTVTETVTEGSTSASGSSSADGTSAAASSSDASDASSTSDGAGVEGESAGPIPAGADAGLHAIPTTRSGLAIWGSLLILAGGVAGLFAGVRPRRSRGH